MTKRTVGDGPQKADRGTSAGFPARLPDADTAARGFVSRAIRDSATRMGWDHAAVSAAAIQRNADALTFFRYSLAEQVAQYIGTLDENIKSVFYYDEGASGIAVGFDAFAFQVHLVAWVTRRTDALHALTGVLNRTLVSACAAAFGDFPSKYVLDLQVADDDDVRRRVGYGALLTSLHHRPLDIWHRQS